jgi:transposase
MALSMDLRRRIIAAAQAGHGTTQIARRFDVSERSVRQFKQRWREGRLEPDRSGPRHPTKITPDDEAILRQRIAADSGVTLRELAEAIDKPVALSTIHRTLKRLGITFKKSRSNQRNNNANT